MYQFLETIQLFDGEFKRLPLHQIRIKKALAEYYPHEVVPELIEILYQTNFPLKGLFKCRVVYDSQIRLIEFLPYNSPMICTLKVVVTDIPNLPYKMAERADYQKAFSQRENCDDVLLVKNGLLTDTSYCNIALYDGKQWFTPEKPLVEGVNRAQLVLEGKLIEKNIKLDDILNFQRISLFNALNEFEKINIKISSVSL